MSSKLITVAVAAGVAGALAVGVCAAAAGASATGGRATTTYTIDKKSDAVTGPSTIAPGYAELSVVGPKSQLFQIVKPRGASVTKSTLVKDAAQIQKGNVKPFEANFKSLGGAVGGSTMFVRLDPGTFYVLDAYTNKLTWSMIRTVHVSGSRIDAARPTLGGTITTVGDMMWATKPTHIASRGYLEFANRSEKNSNNTHFVELDRLKHGKTLADVKKVIEGKEAQSKVFDSGPHTRYSSGILSFGKTEVTSYRLKPGTYFLACFWSNRSTGQPHAFMGMYRAINVG